MISNKNIFSRWVNLCITVGTYIFLYVPVVVIVLFSFNKSDVSIKWQGFSLKWYAKLFSSPEILSAFKVSITVAIWATLLSVVIGTCFVVAISWWKSRFVTLLFYPNIVLPEIVLAIGILSMFAFLKVPLGYTSLIVGHTLIGLGFVIPIVRARFIELDPILTEASLDLGATYFTTFRKVLLPLMSPSLIASALIAFTLSLDDFLISFFCSSPKVETLSIYVYAQLKSMVDPTINAISTCFLVLSSVGIIVLCAFKVVDQVLTHE